MRSYNKKKNNIKKWVWRALVTGAISYTLLTGCNNMGNKKEEWMQSKVHEIHNSEDMPESLEAFVDKYWPKNMVPYIGNRRHSPKQYVINCFLDNYSIYRATGKQEWSARYASLKEVVYHVLETRRAAYE